MQDSNIPFKILPLRCSRCRSWRLGILASFRPITEHLLVSYYHTICCRYSESGLDHSNYTTTNTTAGLQSTQSVLVCNKLWLIVLLVSLLAMSAAGATTVALNLLGNQPEVLNSFMSTLRESSYVHLDTCPPDAPDKNRRLRDVVVVLGDIRPKETYSLITVTTDTRAQPVERLERARRHM